MLYNLSFNYSICGEKSIQFSYMPNINVKKLIS